jgi:dihydropyrimidinase
MVPVIFSEITRNSRISFQRLVKLFCENPAKIFGLYPTKGVLQEGSDADLVLWDPKQKWTVESSSLGGNGDFTTFEGFELLGLPVLTMQRGNVVMRNGKVVGRQGDAKFIPGDVNSAPYANQGYPI